MTFKLPPPAPSKDSRFDQWVYSLWKYLGSANNLTSVPFANQGTTTTVLHGNENGNLSWGPVDLSTDVTGFLSIANLPSFDTVGSTIYLAANYGAL